MHPVAPAVWREDVKRTRAGLAAAQPDRLSVDWWPGLPFAAEPTFADGFLFKNDWGWHATITRDAAGAFTGYELTNGRCRGVEFSRL